MTIINRDDWLRFDELIRSHKRAIVTSHIHPEGDAIGSLVALALYLENRGLEVRQVLHDPVPQVYQFLDPQGRIEPPQTPDLVEFASTAMGIAVDIGDWKRLGDAGPLLRDHCATRVRIDHHPGNEMAVDVCLLDDKAPSAGELIHDLIRTLGGELTPPIAQALYVAILTDTGSFRYDSTRPSTHLAAADLLKSGVSPEKNWELIYQRSSWGRMRLMSLMLQTLTPAFDGRVALFHIDRQMLEETGCRDEEIEGLVDVPRIIGDVIVYVFLRETPEGEIKASLRSRDGFDVRAIAQKFGGGGHIQAAGAVIGRSIEDAYKQLLPEIGKALELRDKQ